MATTVQRADVAEHPTLEQLSGLLDGEAQEARDHIEECARCGELLARLEATREVLRKEVAMPPHLVDAAVAAGVAAATAAKVTSLSRAPRRHRPKPLYLVAGIAAALVAVLGLGSLISGFDRGRVADSLAGGGDDSAVESEDLGAGGGVATADADAANRATEPPEAEDGSGAGAAAPLLARRTFAGEDEVVAYLRSSADAMAATATSCSTEAAAALGAPLEQLRSEDITYQDGPANLWVDPAQRRALVTRPGGCSLLADLRY